MYPTTRTHKHTVSRPFLTIENQHNGPRYRYVPPVRSSVTLGEIIRGLPNRVLSWLGIDFSEERRSLIQLHATQRNTNICFRLNCFSYGKLKTRRERIETLANLNHPGSRLSIIHNGINSRDIRPLYFDLLLGWSFKNLPN